MTYRTLGNPKEMMEKRKEEISSLRTKKRQEMLQRKRDLMESEPTTENDKDDIPLNCYKTIRCC